MATIVKLVQGSDAWHEHRRKHRNASETSAVVGVSPWQTAHQLWQLKTNRAPQPEVTAAMAHGTQMEPFARAAYEAQMGLVLQPLVLVDGEYSASLDGVTFDGELTVEIKAPYKGRDSELWKAVAQGRIPEHYRIQIQHQLMVAGAARAHLYVFDGADGILIEERPRKEDWIAIREEWDTFARFVTEDRPPPLTDRDTVVRTDEAWQAAAQAYLALKTEADAATSRLDEAKANLIGLAQHSSEKGFGVNVTRFLKSGAIQYSKVPALVGVDLEKYRGVGREETRVSVTK